MKIKIFITLLLFVFTQSIFSQVYELEPIIHRQEKPKQSPRIGRESPDRNKKPRTIKPKPVKVKTPKVKTQAELESEKAIAYDKLLSNLRVEIIKWIDKAQLDKELNSQAIKDLQEIKKELTSSNWRTNSQLALSGAVIGSMINTTCDLIFNLMEIPPGSKLVVNGIDLSRKVIETSITSEKIDIEEINKVLGEMIIQEKVTAGKPLLEMALAFKELGDDINEMTKIEGNWRKLRREVRSQINSIDNAIIQYEKKIKESQRLIEEKEKIIKHLDDYKKLNKSKILG